MSDFIDGEIEKQRRESYSRREEIRKVVEKIEQAKAKQEEEERSSCCIRCKRQGAKFSLCRDCIVEMSYNSYLDVYGDV